MIKPEGWHPSAHLSPGLRVEDFIFTSGQVGRDQKTGRIRETVREQTEQALMNVKTILEEAGASVIDVVKVTVFLSDMSDYGEMNKVYTDFFDEPQPARSCIGTNLARPEYRVEIEAIAYKPKGPSRILAMGKS